jgi:hypothetical protein
VGGAAAGVVGAVVITPLVGVVRVIRSELARDDFPGVTTNAPRRIRGRPRRVLEPEVDNSMSL